MLKVKYLNLRASVIKYRLMDSISGNSEEDLKTISISVKRF